MTAPNFVVVGDAGDPANPGTWSGTPSNLIAALRRHGNSVEGLNLTLSRYLRGGLKYFSAAIGSGNEFRRSRLASSIYALRNPYKNAPAGTVFLHTSTSSVPHHRKGKNVRHVVFIDSTFARMSSHATGSYSEHLRKKYDEYERSALAAADHVFLTSECVRADVIGHYGIPPERATAVGTGMGGILPRAGEKDYSSCTTLLVAKQRFEEKGGLLVLEGFAQAQKADSRLKLIVVAAEPYREMTERLPGATFKTSLSWDELNAHFNDASLFAMPALHEPWGLVYIEALACRTPVLGLNRNALPEFTQNGKYGFLLDDPTPASVSAAMLKAFSDPKQLAEMGRGGQEYVQGRYTWDQVATKICEALS